MTLALLAFLAGALTIVSPCILPVLPFVFARSDQPFVRSTLPLLCGMAVTFAVIATLAAVGGSWAVHLNSAGRVVALVVLAILGVTLLSKRAAEWLSRPFVALGNRLLSQGAGAPSVAQSAILGVATGFLWAPCAGPVLGLILTGAAINGANAATTLLLFSYALGAIGSLALATIAGGRVFALLKKSLGAGEWVRRGLGVAVLAAVVAIALGWDTGVLTRLSSNSTGRIEQSLIAAIPAHGTTPTANATTADGHSAPVEGQLPSLAGATAWLNSAPLTREALRGKVVLIDFWTYSCINCLRTLPYVRAWYERYKDHGFVVIGVHAPEFAFEKDEGNVRDAIRRFGVTYPVAMDNDYTLWKAFNNQYWPAHYFIDAQGRIRGHHFGEGNYDGSERLIRELLAEAGQTDLPPALNAVQSEGIQSAADKRNVASPETYVGYGRAENFVSPGGFERDREKQYATPADLHRNEWALTGSWIVGKESAATAGTNARLTFRFHARDLHLVLGPGADGKPLRFRVTLDDAEPGNDHGVDIDAQGNGMIREQRLYQLIRQSGEVRDRTFTIEFLDAGSHAFAFTFG